MDKKVRNQLGDQLGVAIAAILKGMHDGAAGKVEKQIQSLSREIAKKFLKAKKDILRKAEEKKNKTKKVVKKVKAAVQADKAVKRVRKPASKKSVAKKSATRAK